MKTNGAPEKIWMDLEWIHHFDCKDCITEDSVEYIRTDVFIEKMWNWIDATFHETSIDGFGGESVDVVMSNTSVYKDDLFESFKNYIKGE